MKTCSICGHQFPDDLKECPVCGTPAPSADENKEKSESEASGNAASEGLTPPPVPEDIPPVSEAGPKTRIVSESEVPNSSAGSIPPSGGYTVPPTGGSAVPPSGEGNEPPRRNNTALWIVIGVLSAIILIGATWWIASSVYGSESKSGDADSDSLANDVEVVDYDTDDTPTDAGEEADADTIAAADYDNTSSDNDNSSSSSAISSSSDDDTNVITGNLVLNGQNKTCYVKLSFDLNDNEVSGKAYFNNTSADISGNYYPGSHKLLIYEDGGGRYEGYVNGNTYSGSYHDDAGTWSFSMNVH